MEQADYAAAYEHGFAATRRFLLARGAQFEEADEIAQAAWVRGWECRNQLRDPSLVGYWVNSIARNMYLAQFRGLQMSSLEGADPSYRMNLDRDIELRRMLEQCGARDRQLLEKSLGGYATVELAKQEGISSTGIRVRLLRIRQALRQQLALAA